MSSDKTKKSLQHFDKTVHNSEKNRTMGQKKKSSSEICPNITNIHFATVRLSLVYSKQDLITSDLRIRKPWKQ